MNTYCNRRYPCPSASSLRRSKVRVAEEWSSCFASLQRWTIFLQQKPMKNILGSALTPGWRALTFLHSVVVCKGGSWQVSGSAAPGKASNILLSSQNSRVSCSAELFLRCDDDDVVVPHWREADTHAREMMPYENAYFGDYLRVFTKSARLSTRYYERTRSI